MGDALFMDAYFMENPSYKWMTTGSTPISGNPHIALPGQGVKIFIFGGVINVFFKGMGHGGYGYDSHIIPISQ